MSVTSASVPAPSAVPFYITGGTLPPEASSYVTRQADEDLRNALMAGEYCYVLNSRQMGKSSLCVRTMGRLRQAGVRTVFVDLTKLGGSNLSAEQWYAGLLSVMGRELGLRGEFLAYWKTQAAQGVGPLPRLFGALEEVALPASDAPIVVFVDEIDATRSLPFSADEFFSAIRQLYVERAVNPALKRLSFCLLGTAAPSDLIQDTRISPFNIGRRVEVTDFTPQEAAPLAKGLNHGEHGGHGEKLLQRVLYWTNGHPYLTQRLCSAIVEAQYRIPNTEHRTPSVDKLCADLFLTHTAKESDNNLTFVRDRLLKSDAEPAAVLDLYGQVRDGKRVADDDTNPLCAALKLSGVARVENGLLRVRNRIYAQVFDKKWVADHTADAELRRQKTAYWRGMVRAAVMGTAIAVILSGLAVYGFVQTRAARRNAQLANDKTLEANRARDNADYNLYVANMNLIQREWESNNVAHVLELLKATDGYKGRGFEWGYWNRLNHLSLKIFSGHTGGVNSVAFSPDGKRIVTGSMDKTAKVWNVQTGEALLTLKGHTDYISAVAFSPDGTKIVTGSHDKTAKVWDAQTGHELLSVKGRTEGISSISFSVDDGKMHVEIDASKTGVESVGFSPDGKNIVTGCLDAMKVWDAQTGHELLAVKGAANGISSFSFSPDGTRIVTGSWDGAAKVWDAQTGHKMLTLNGHASRVSSVCFSPDGTKIVTGSDDNTARIWNAQTGKSLLSLKGHTGGVSSVAFSPDGKRVVTGSSDKTAKVWDTQTGHEALTFKGYTDGVSSVAFSPDGKNIVTNSNNNTAGIWDATIRHDVLELKGHTNAGSSVAFSPDSTKIVTGSSDKTAKVWDAQTGEFLLSLKGHTGSINAVAFSPDGKHIVTGSGDKTAKVWDVQTGHEALTLRGHTISVDTVAFSPDGKRVVTGGQDNTAKIWDAQTGQEALTFKGHTDSVFAVAFSPDSKRVVTSSADGTVKVWDAQTGHEVLMLKGDIDYIRSVSYSPDGTKIVTDSQDNTASMWDAQTGYKILTFKGHTDSVSSVVFSPDGKRIVTGSSDKTAKVWDAQTGQELLTLKGHTDGIRSVAFSSDGKRIVTGSNDGTAKVWFADDTRLGKVSSK